MKKAKLFMMLALLVMGVSNVFAQNVTVHPGNGNLLPARKSSGGDVFFRWGGSATWKHEQLSLTITTGDTDNNSGTDTNGQLANPANDIFESADGKCLQIGKGGINGNGMDTYITMCLPNGYRFRGYRIVFHRIDKPDGDNVSDVRETPLDISFGETDKNFNYTYVNDTYQGDITQGSTTKYTLERHSNDMSNLLYFRLSNGVNTGRAFIQLDEVELYFTAENNYTPLIPVPNVNGVGAVNIPFTTNKMDYGNLFEQEDANRKRICYNGTIHDMNANMILYEANSIKEVEDNGYDGTAGYMVDFEKSGSISSEGDYFKIGPTNYNGSLEKIKIDGVEKEAAIYFIESPIWATSAASETAHKNPIGYRITGASFDLKGVGDATPATFRIQHVGSDGKTYGLNQYEETYLQFNERLDYQTIWRIDGDGYIYFGTGSSTRYLCLITSGGYATPYFQVTSTKPNEYVGTFEIVENENNGTKQIRLKNYTDYYIGFYEYEGNNGTQSYAYLTTDDDRAFYTEVSPAGTTTVDKYTFVIFDKTGTKVEKKVEVDGTNETLSIDGLNNDAVKIGVIGTGYVAGHITMQALAPYIDHLNIVCQEKSGNGGRLTQQFNATDFSVRGGKFTFYAPTDFKGDYKFSFENLYSLYGDNTYYNETSSTNHSRYSFVWSPYYKSIAQGTKNVYDTDPDHPYTDKIYTEKRGTRKHLFNNAETVTTKGGEFEEYPFNPDLYKEKVDGEFEDFIFTEDDVKNKTTKTAYLFTCDETRYNIAPTTATQHTFYAYYEMTIDMQLKKYDPVLTWEKLYDNTFYVDENRETKTDSKWGLKVTTKETVDDNGRHSGYLTVSQIVKAINDRDGGNTVEGGPESSDQILYIDASDLMYVVENQTPSTTVNGEEVTVTYTTHSLNELMSAPDSEKGLDKNALIYLPYGSQATYDNFAYNTVAKYNETPNFHGTSNIVITDRYPFFAPYDIQVDAAKLLKYDRLLTPAEGYDNVVNATVMLPFTIGVTKGVHDPKANDASLTKASPFTISTMNEDAALAKVKSYNYGTVDTEGVGYFKALDDTVKNSKANYPYVVTIDNVQDGDYNFHVRQKGARVVATPPSANDNSTANGIFTGTPSNGSVDGTDYTLTPTATYMGRIIDKAKSVEPAVFYFSKDLFLTTRTMTDKQSLKIYPFRSFYEYPAPATAKMTSFRIVFGENDEMGGTNGIDEIQRDADLAVIPGSRSITLMARADKNVTIHAVNGQTVDKCNLRAGETRTVSVPAGVYVINGVKMVVK